jgi:hypothetical protein
MTGVSMTRIALVAQKSGQSIFESLKTIGIVVVVVAAGSVSIPLFTSAQVYMTTGIKTIPFVPIILPPNDMSRR